MDNTPAFQYYPSDLIADTKVMFWSMEEVGCYWQMITYLWLNGGIFEFNPHNLAILFRVKRESTALKLWEKISNKFQLENGIVTHRRVLKEMQKQAESRDKRSEAGKIGAEKRWKEHGNANGNATKKTMAKNSSSTPTPTSTIVKYNTNRGQGVNPKPQHNSNVGSCFSQKEVLELDLKIAEKKNWFAEQLVKIFIPSKREAVTFSRITLHLVNLAQADPKNLCLFDDALEWARSAKSSTATNKKGLWVAKVKKETGFRSQPNLLGKRVVA